MLRIALLLATNLAVIVLASVTLSLLGFEGFLKANGVELDLAAVLVFCALIGFGGAFVSLLLSKPIARWSTGTRTIEQPRNPQEQWLVDTVRELARAAGIGKPQIGIFEAAQPNAFATGWNRNDALVAVSSGLLQHMRPNEIRAVLAHEIGHTANRDMVTLTLIQGVVNTFVMFLARIVGYVVDRVVLKNERGLGIGYFITTIIAEILLGLLAMMIVMWFSRYREFRADAAGARLAGRDNMVAALERLKAGSEMDNAMPESMQAFGINSGIRHGISALFASHPPIEQRIATLRASG